MLQEYGIAWVISKHLSQVLEGWRKATSANTNRPAVPGQSLQDYPAKTQEEDVKTALPKITEAQFLNQVLQLAKLKGWKTAHFRPGLTRKGAWVTAVQGDGKGWPDLFMVRKDRRLAAELKVGCNKVTKEQIEWAIALNLAGIACFIWRPDDWATIETILE